MAARVRHDPLAGQLGHDEAPRQPRRADLPLLLGARLPGVGGRLRESRQPFFSRSPAPIRTSSGTASPARRRTLQGDPVRVESKHLAAHANTQAIVPSGTGNVARNLTLTSYTLGKIDARASRRFV